MWCFAGTGRSVALKAKSDGVHQAEAKATASAAGPTPSSDASFFELPTFLKRGILASEGKLPLAGARDEHAAASNLQVTPNFPRAEGAPPNPPVGQPVLPRVPSVTPLPAPAAPPTPTVGSAKPPHAPASYWDEPDAPEGEDDDFSWNSWDVKPKAAQRPPSPPSPTLGQPHATASPAPTPPRVPSPPASPEPLPLRVVPPQLPVIGAPTQVVSQIELPRYSEPVAPSAKTAVAPTPTAHLPQSGATLRGIAQHSPSPTEPKLSLDELALLDATLEAFPGSRTQILARHQVHDRQLEFDRRFWAERRKSNEAVEHEYQFALAKYRIQMQIKGRFE